MAERYRITFVHRESGTKTVLDTERNVRARAQLVSCRNFPKSYLFGFLPVANDGYTLSPEQVAWLPQRLRGLAAGGGRR